MTSEARTMSQWTQQQHASEPRGPAQVTTLSRKAAAGREIRRAVALGYLKPGAKVTEAQLASDLGVSRPTVREALNQLTGEGLIVQEPYRGFRIAEVNNSQLRDIAATRVGLDMLAIDAILADPTGRRMSIVQEGWTQFSRTTYDPDPIVQLEAHLTFHRQIWIASENYMLINLWPVTKAHITIALAADQRTRSDPDRAYRLHAELMDAILTEDCAAIHKAFIAHTIDSAEELISLLAKGGKPS